MFSSIFTFVLKLCIDCNWWLVQLDKYHEYSKILNYQRYWLTSFVWYVTYLMKKCLYYLSFHQFSNKLFAVIFHIGVPFHWWYLFRSNFLHQNKMHNCHIILLSNNNYNNQSRIIQHETLLEPTYPDWQYFPCSDPPRASHRTGTILRSG